MGKVLILFIKSVNDLLILSAHEESSNELRTVRHYEEQTISYQEVNSTCDELFELLNSECRRSGMDKYIFDHFKHFGQSLFDRLFTQEVKKFLYSSKCEDLILQIDSNLVQIPWELLHNGETFLCQKFNIGRIVNTEQTIESNFLRAPKIPYKILILADPNKDLKDSRKEGKIIFEKFRELDNHKDSQRLFEIKLKSDFITTEYIKKSLREFDIIHYAGHAKYDFKDPSNGSWQTADGELLVEEIKQMIGGAPLPYLIFSNACQSGQTEPWHIGIHSGGKTVFGLTNAFLLAGVQHYIGTFWKIPDKQGLNFAVRFYENLLTGMSIGQAISNARLHLIESYGEKNLTSMAYMLYGDPRYVYFKQDNVEGVYNISGYPVDGSPSPSSLIDTDKEVDSSYSNMRNPKNKIYLSHSWLTHYLKVVISLLLLLLIVITTYGVLKWISPSGTSNPDKTYPNFLIPCDPNEIDRLIADIENLYIKKGGNQKSYFEDEWTSTPITMAVFGYLSEEYMFQDESIRLYQKSNELVREIVTIIQNQKFIHLVDRKHLDRILKEYKFSLSSLAKSDNNLCRVGKAMGARLLMFLEFLPNEKRPKVAVDIVETDTTVKAVTFITPFNEENKTRYIHQILDSRQEYGPIINQIAERVVKEIKNRYPLKGKIKGIDNLNKVEINLGLEVGIKNGAIMTVLGKNNEFMQIGRIEITKVTKDHAHGRVLEEKRPFSIGDKIIGSPEN